MTEQMPAAIAGAIVAIMGEVPKLEKTEKNTHGDYNFAGIDGFLEAVRPLCAKHQLVIIQNEDSLTSDAGWLTMRFGFTFAHAGGEMWGPVFRSIVVNGKMGSQAFGAAQSYSLKQFMRSIFQIATGEKGQDIDEHKAEDLPEIKFLDWKAFGLTKTGAREQWAEVSRMIHAATSKIEIDGLLEDHANIVEAIKQCSDTWHHCQSNIDGKIAQLEEERNGV